MNNQRIGKRILNKLAGYRNGLCLLFILFLGGNLYGQGQNNYDPSLLIMIEEGVELMESGQYTEADRNFKRVLRNLEVLPAEISFYFGKNSYFLKNYKQSINWLNKYIELKGTKGQFFEESVEYLNRAEMAYKLQSEKDSKNVLNELTSSNEFDCKGHTHFKCPICTGEGVLIKPGKMNDVLYQTCPYCNGSGFITCDQYKLYLRGELKPSD
jgi:tetratricopeptide (TPR) repeat protein